MWSDLQERLGRPVFEIATLPPSVPGMRVFRTLRDRLRALGGRMIVNSPVLGAEHADGRVVAVRAAAAGREVTYRARWVVLATGGVGAGGVELDSRWRPARPRSACRCTACRGRARAASIPSTSPTTRSRASASRSTTGCAPSIPGPGGSGGDRVAENVLVAGAMMAGSRPWKEKSGDGLSLSSGHRAAELILEEDR